MPDHNEKLRAAIATFDATENALPNKPQAAYAVVEAARLALAVFEKAHTPTGDEREAQGWREAAMYDGDAQTQDDFMTGWRTADRLRRSEVPEPLFPGQTIAEAVEIMREAETRRTIAAEPQGEPSNRVIVMCARCGLFPVVGGDEINSDIVVCDRCAFAEGRESAQGEPSDAKVDAGAQALFNEMLRESSIGDVNGTFERCRDSARLVLRAAGGVR